MAGFCNDAWGGEGTLLPTGSMPECTADGTTYDMSGNLAEWVRDWDPDNQDCAVTVGYGYVCEICEYGQDCADCTADNECHISQYSECGGEGQAGESFPRGMAKPYLGTRCCFDRE
jgi:formylglycine-generating enzyme required for sulfatase activity